MNKVLYVSCHKDNNTNDPMGTLEYLSFKSRRRLTESADAEKKNPEKIRKQTTENLKMANPLLNCLMVNDRRLLKKIFVVLGFHLVVIIAIGALEMVGITANIPNSETFVGFFMLFVGWRFFGLFEEDFGMAYADKFLAFIDYLRHTVSFQLFN